MTYDLYQVAPDMIDDFWPLVQDHLGRALQACNPDETLDHLHRKLCEQKAQLWVVTRNNIGIIATGTTEILVANSGLKLLNVTTLGGSELDKWFHLWPRIEWFAKSEGCAKLRFHGRRGWVRLMKGYHEPWVTLERDI